MEAEEGQHCTLHFTVSDTGIGVPLEKQKLIFEPFAQADTSTTRKYGGTGLGLTISARLVEMMGGKIWMESEAGKGTQFHFTRRMESRGAVTAIGTIAPPEILRGGRVLVVDDNRTNRRILDGMLRRWEMEVTLVEGGEEALTELSNAQRAGQPYALVLTDVHMPGMHGLLNWLRGIQAPAGIVRIHDPDAHVGRPARRRRALPRAESLRVPAQTHPAIRNCAKRLPECSGRENKRGPFLW